MPDIEQNIRQVEKRIAAACERAGRSPEDVTLIAVTKGVEPWAIEAAHRAGIRHFGENRVQEAREKIERLSHLEPRPVWHMVGHLQTNKVKTAVMIFDIIHSVDSLRLAQAVSSHAEATFPVLIEVNVSAEETKGGLSVAEVSQAVEEIARLPRLEIKGLMTIAPLVEDPEEVRSIFRGLRELKDSLGLRHLSMGMTDDFPVAIEEGATMVRIGRAIFGETAGRYKG